MLAFEFGVPEIVQKTETIILIILVIPADDMYISPTKKRKQLADLEERANTDTGAMLEV